MIQQTDIASTNGGAEDLITTEQIYREELEKPQVSPKYEYIDPFFRSISTEFTRETKSHTAIIIERTFYTKKMNESIEWLSENHKSPIESTPHIQRLLANLKIYKEDYFDDPYSSFISALYDALVFNDSWINLEKEHYKELKKIMIQINNKSNLNYDAIDKAINKIEKLGLDSTPF